VEPRLSRIENDCFIRVFWVVQVCVCSIRVFQWSSVWASVIWTIKYFYIVYKGGFEGLLYYVVAIWRQLLSEGRTMSLCGSSLALMLYPLCFSNALLKLLSSKCVLSMLTWVYLNVSHDSCLSGLLWWQLKVALQLQSLHKPGLINWI